MEASVSGRDLGSTASEVRQVLTAQLRLPAGYFFDLGGRVESQARASRALPVYDSPLLQMVVMRRAGFVADNRNAETRMVLLARLS